MPLTPKEKMKAYRERLKQNQEKAEDVKKKDRERKQIKKFKMTQSEQATERLQNQKRVAKHRAEKKAESSLVQEAKRVPGQIQTRNLISTPPFKTPQTLGKAKNKVQGLPPSPTKRRAVVTALANDMGLAVKNPGSDAGSANRAVDTETAKKVTDFYLETSWMCPGQKDTFIIRHPGEQKKVVQKQYMLTTIKEAHAMFLDDNPGCSISLSKFASLRPPQVQVQGDIPHNACLCKYHENIRLLLQDLRKVGLQLPTDFRSYIALLVCNQESEACMSGSCDFCPGISHLTPSEDIAQQNMSWQQWTTDAKQNRETFQGTVQTCFNVLKETTPYFLQHTFVKRVQAAEFKQERESVEDDPDKVVIQVDFAENFTTKTQNEIQSAYWAYNQVTLFTVCAWEKGGVHSLVIVSDYLHHDKYAVNKFLKTIFQWLDSEIKRFKEIVMFSDGAASQFKQRFLLCSLTLMDRPIIWNFFATSHGKGPVDGIGGTAKRVVAKEVMSGKAEVQTSQQFANVAQSKCPNMTIVHVDKTDIVESIAELDKVLEGIRAIPNTKRMHRLSVKHAYCIDAQSHANANPITHCFRVALNDDNSSQESGIDDDGREDNFSGADDDAEDDEESMDTADEESMGTADGSDEVNDQDNINSNNRDISNVEENPEENNDLDSLNYKWVEVQYSKEKNAKKFTGQVVEAIDSKITVKFLKQAAPGKYVWPEIDDVDIIPRSNIIAILNEPQMDRRDTLSFK